MNFMGMLSSLPKLSSSLRNNNFIRTITTNTPPVCFQFTNQLFGEPLKKKRRLDPAILRAREERKKRRLAKAIRYLERNAKQLKPLIENEISLEILDNLKWRERKLPKFTLEQIEEHYFLNKEWSIFMNKEKMKEREFIISMINSQKNALEELKEESEELYMAALSMENDLIPFSIKGPCYTPPIKDYPEVDGLYTDITRRFAGDDAV